MMPVDLASIVFCLLIVALVLFAFWKHGRGNPQDTGELARQLSKHKSAIEALEGGMKECATRGSLDLLAEQVRNLEAHAASSGEVLALSMKVTGINDTLGAKIDGMKAAADRTEAAVSRIEGYFLQRGVNGQ